MCETPIVTETLTPQNTVKAPATSANNPSLKGQLASKKVLHGENSRFATFAVHTRFDAVQWFTADALRPDDKTGLPEIVRQSATFEEALHGLY
jgi:hypothetical protein